MGLRPEIGSAGQRRGGSEVSYLKHLKQQTMHQLRAPLGLGNSLAAAGVALWEVIIRLICVPLLPLAPLFAIVCMRDERKRARQYEEAKARRRANIHQNGPATKDGS